MRVVRITTTAYSEEDFFLLTTLPDDQIVECIQPIIDAERNEQQEYDNEDLLGALVNEYPLDLVKMYNDFETISL